jgi:hypothetical protein
MFTTNKRIIINSLEQLQVLERNPVAVTQPVIGEGTSYDDFDGFVVGNFVHIYPFVEPFDLSQLVEIRKLDVKADSLLYTVANPNFSAVTNGSYNVVGTRVSERKSARRKAKQVGTLTVNAVPLVGSNCKVRFEYTTPKRDKSFFNEGTKPLVADFVITSAETTTALVAAKLKRVLDELFALNTELAGMTVAIAGNVLTITGLRETENYVIVTSSGIIDTYTPLDATFVVTAPAFAGINDYDWLCTYQKNNEGMWNIRDNSTDYMPLKGKRYVSYFIKHRIDSEWEHQSGTLNAEQQHIITVEIYVEESLTPLITKLDLLGAF